MKPSRVSILALAFTVFLAEASTLQWLAGAYSSDYSSSASDESSHFVSSLMLRDIVADGGYRHPWTFAREYYLHYPKVGVGHWPPLLYVAAGIWMLLFGTSRIAMMLFVATCAAALATVVFAAARALVGAWAGWLAGGLFLALPLTQEATGRLMPEHLGTLLTLGSALWFARFVITERSRDAWCFGGLAAAAILTRGSGWALAGVPILVVILTRRLDLLTSRRLWPAALPPLLFGATWYLLTRGLRANDGAFYDAPPLFWWTTLISFPAIVASSLGVVLTVLAGLGLWFRVARPWIHRSVDPRWAALVALAVATVVLHSVVPVGTDRRYMFAVVVSMVLFATAGLSGLASLASRRVENGVALSTTIIAIVLAWTYSNFHVPNQLHGDGYETLSRRLDAMLHGSWVYLIAADAKGEGSMIAAIAARDARPRSIVLRGSKLLTREDWLGRPTGDHIPSVQQVNELLDRIPVDVIVFDESIAGDQRRAYHGRLEEAISQSTGWHEMGRFRIVRAGHEHAEGLRVLARYPLRSPADAPAFDRTLLTELVLPASLR